MRVMILHVVTVISDITHLVIKWMKTGCSASNVEHGCMNPVPSSPVLLETMTLPVLYAVTDLVKDE